MNHFPFSVFRLPSSIFRLPLPFPERRLVLMALDLLAMNGALLLALALRPGYGLEGTLVLRHPFWFLLLSLLWLLIAHTFDAYEPRVAGRFSSSARAGLQAGLITAGVYLLIPYVTPPLPTSRSSLLAFPLITIGALLASRGLCRVVLNQPALRRRALIIGAGWAGRAIAEALAEYGDGTYQLVGFVDDDPAKLGKGAWERGSRRAGEQGSKGARKDHLCTPSTLAPMLRRHLCASARAGQPLLPPGPDPSTSRGYPYSGDYTRC